jgi:hypothetical protein
LTYLERQKCYGPDKKILFKKQLFDLEVNRQGPHKGQYGMTSQNGGQNDYPKNNI